MHALAFPLALLAAQAGDSGLCRKPFARHLYVNLESLVAEADRYANACVRTKGRLRGRPRVQEDVLRVEWMLMLEDPESGLRLSVSPRGDLAEEFYEDAFSLVGRGIEVAGLFTVSPPGWLTFSAYEVLPEAARRPGEILSLCDVVGSPAAYDGQKVVVWAPFRGRNVFRDLPDETRPHAEAWVVGDEDCAVWITGHAPSGKGFHFDAPPPAVRWLKVQGKMEKRGRTVVLKASSVALAPPRD